MKTKFFLTPPIADIEQRLFGVSYALIGLVESNAVSPRIAAAVRRSPEWAARPRHDPAAEVPPPADNVPHVPPSITALIRRRMHARQPIDTPAPGQIVQVRRIVTPEAGQLDWVLQAPLNILLDCEAESPGLWHGWLMSSEVDYAGWWDFVLQDQDEPFEPEAAMVQVWNPVRLYLPMADRTVGRLAIARLQAVRALAAEYATTPLPTMPAPWLGRIAERATVGELSVVTGSPVRSDADPRYRYQQLYFRAADAVREPARLAIASLAATPAASMRQSLFGMAQLLGLLSAPRLAQAMSAAEEGDLDDLVWPDKARIRIERLDAETGEIHITALGPEPVECRLRQDGVLLAKGVANRDGGAVLRWETGPGIELRLSMNANHSVSIPIPH